MPSPFPGMDPYLESPEIFPDFHDSFITYLREALQAACPPPISRRSADGSGSRSHGARSAPTWRCARGWAVDHARTEPAGAVAVADRTRGAARRGQGRAR